MLYNTDNQYAVETVKNDSKLRDACNLIRLIRFSDRIAKTDAKTDTELTDSLYNKLLYNFPTAYAIIPSLFTIRPITGCFTPGQRIISRYSPMSTITFAGPESLVL